MENELEKKIDSTGIPVMFQVPISFSTALPIKIRNE